jgi:hypothetical protein
VMALRYSEGRYRVKASWVSYMWLSESKTGKSTVLRSTVVTFQPG